MTPLVRAPLLALGVATLCVQAFLWAQAPAPETVVHRVDRARLIRDVTTLASPAFEGRRTGTPGALKVRRWLMDEFREAGLTPGGTDGFLQPFTLTSRDSDPSPASGSSAQVGGARRQRDRAGPRPRTTKEAARDHGASRSSWHSRRRPLPRCGRQRVGCRRAAGSGSPFRPKPAAASDDVRRARCRRDRLARRACTHRLALCSHGTGSRWRSTWTWCRAAPRTKSSPRARTTRPG